jgi:pimeloyl-ACP methyl ester carboxylesterase
MKRRRRAGKFETVPLPIWQELLVGVEFVYLRVSPVFWGYGIPHGDGTAVVLVPGFLGTDFYLKHFHEWLRRIGYQAFHSGIGLNAECPNLLIQRHLTDTIETAFASTRRKVHLIGHSLGGMIACASAAQMPDLVQSVITLGTPVRKVACHPSIIRGAEFVRSHILERHGAGVLPDCYTGACTCDFFESLSCRFPPAIRQTAIFTKMDGVVDWRVCKTGDPRVDVEASATHMGLVFSPLVYSLVAHRLADK